MVATLVPGQRCLRGCWPWRRRHCAMRGRRHPWRRRATRWRAGQGAVAIAGCRSAISVGRWRGGVGVLPVRRPTPRWRPVGRVAAGRRREARRRGPRVRPLGGIACNCRWMGGGVAVLVDGRGLRSLRRLRSDTLARDGALLYQLPVTDLRVVEALGQAGGLVCLLEPDPCRHALPAPDEIHGLDTAKERKDEPHLFFVPARREAAHENAPRRACCLPVAGLAVFVVLLPLRLTLRGTGLFLLRLAPPLLALVLVLLPPLLLLPLLLLRCRHRPQHRPRLRRTALALLPSGLPAQPCQRSSQLRAQSLRDVARVLAQPSKAQRAAVEPQQTQRRLALTTIADDCQRRAASPAPQLPESLHENAQRIEAEGALGTGFHPL
mmetsp:Transcript_59990/g.178552  ORF Transcript_59990/g.178552 Transcript_59990/m.178552 type:complete len:379 (-) Transcript_59990:1042-2178(-)